MANLPDGTATFLFSDIESSTRLAQICYRLDRIPLAIEMAAARVKALDVDQINRRLYGGRRICLVNALVTFLGFLARLFRSAALGGEIVVDFTNLCDPFNTEELSAVTIRRVTRRQIIRMDSLFEACSQTGF
jgi:hypothetical protein